MDIRQQTAKWVIDGLISKLHDLLTEVPNLRIATNGTRLELRETDGHYHDAGLDAVNEFQKAFNLPAPTTPHMPTMWPEHRRALGVMVEEMEQLGERFKGDAAHMVEVGDEGSALIYLRLQLCQEELAELGRGLVNGDLVECLDALTDMTYVADGTFLTLGLGHYKASAREEVHASNMTKLGEDGKPVLSDAGRVMKGPNYRPPDLESLL